MHQGPSEQQSEVVELTSSPPESAAQSYRKTSRVSAKPRTKTEVLDEFERTTIDLAQEVANTTGLSVEKLIARCIPGREKVTGNRHNTFMRMHRAELGPGAAWDQQEAEEAYRAWCEQYPTVEAQDEELGIFEAIADLDLGETTPAARKKNFASMFARNRKLVSMIHQALSISSTLLIFFRLSMVQKSGVFIPRL